MTSRPAYYERIDADTFSPTADATGAWSPDEQHFSPVSGLIVHAVETARAGATGPSTISRISHDILGQIPVGPTTITVRTVRPGRTIELVEAVTAVGGRDVVRTRVWLLGDTDTGAVAGTEREPMPVPLAFPGWAMERVWPGGFISSIRVHRETETPPGRARAWIGTDRDLVAGEPSSELARFAALIDTANGIAGRADPEHWIFPNIDLTVHLFRYPTGDWTGLDTTVAIGATGQGLTSTVLHDLDGPVGTAEQSLTVRPRP